MKQVTRSQGCMRAVVGKKYTVRSGIGMRSGVLIHLTGPGNGAGYIPDLADVFINTRDPPAGFAQEEQTQNRIRKSFQNH